MADHGETILYGLLGTTALLYVAAVWAELWRAVLGN